MKRKLSYFNPYFNDVNGIKSVIEYALGQEITKIEIMISVGYNGSEFLSSTDWLITLADGRQCIQPFFSNPQNMTFITVTAGMEIKTNPQGRMEIGNSQRSAVLIMPEGEQAEFAPGEYIRIAVQPGNRHFIGTDCDVKVTKTDEKTFYRIKPDENTHYASFDGQKISKAL